MSIIILDCLILSKYIHHDRCRHVLLRFILSIFPSNICVAFYTICFWWWRSCSYFLFQLVVWVLPSLPGRGAPWGADAEHCYNGGLGRKGDIGGGGKGWEGKGYYMRQGKGEIHGGRTRILHVFQREAEKWIWRIDEQKLHTLIVPLAWVGSRLGAGDTITVRYFCYVCL